MPLEQTPKFLGSIGDQHDRKFRPSSDPRVEDSAAPTPIGEAPQLENASISFGQVRRLRPNTALPAYLVDNAFELKGPASRNERGAPPPRTPISRESIAQNGLPSLINIDKSGANNAGIKAYNDAHSASVIEMRQCKYLNDIVEEDHRNIKRRSRAMLGFKSFWTARVVLGGIELVHMLRKGQLASTDGHAQMTAAEAFYLLAA